MYKPLTSKFEELKARIKKEMKELPESFVRKAIFSMKKRAARVVSKNGGPVEGNATML